jgi:hypothetical protein
MRLFRIVLGPRASDAFFDYYYYYYYYYYGAVAAPPTPYERELAGDLAAFEGFDVL